MDMELDKLVTEKPNVIINTSADREYVAEVERRIRVVKERAQAMISVLPYKYIPDVMTINLIYFSAFGLKIMPLKQDIRRNSAQKSLFAGKNKTHVDGVT